MKKKPTKSFIFALSSTIKNPPITKHFRHLVVIQGILPPIYQGYYFSQSKALYMLTTSFLSILGVIIGFLIGGFFQKKGNADLQSKYKEADTELHNLKKQQKKEKKKQHQFMQQKTAMEDKLKAMEEKYIPLTKDLKSQITKINQELVAKTESHDKLTTIHARTKHELEQIKKKHQELQETYSTDMKDSKGWKNKREQFEQEITGWKKKYAVEKKGNQNLKTTLETQNTKMVEVAKFTQEFKNMRASNRKLKKDLEYWEKKHFDTHHELAESITEIKSLQAASVEADLLIKDSENQKENILEQIKEFKTKFVNVNNLYHELKAKNEQTN